MTEKRQRTLFAALFLGTGAALVVYALSGVSLLAAAGLALTVALVAGAMVWQRASPRSQREMRLCLQAGLMAGLLATSAYDLSRLFLIEVTGIAFWPFDIFNIFGQALFGTGYNGAWVRLAGLLYHFTNGIGFALAYTILAGRRGVWAGVIWALVLELLMVSIYPGWLGLEALNEFVQVSVVGHLVYGAVLGYSARWMLAYLEARDGNS